MFSDMPREHYKEELAQHQEGVLDIIQRAGINVLWNDNDGGCKGACDRVPHQNVTALAFADPLANPVQTRADSVVGTCSEVRGERDDLPVRQEQRIKALETKLDVVVEREARCRERVARLMARLGMTVEEDDEDGES